MVTPEHLPCQPGDPLDHHNHDTFFELQGPSGSFGRACVRPFAQVTH
jgi:hypothetical protein